MRPVSRLAALFAVVTAACLLLPGIGAAIALGLVVGVWMVLRRRRDRNVWVAVAAAIVVVLLLADSHTRAAGSRASRFEARVAERYEALWQGLEDSAARTIARLQELSPLPEAERLRIFESVGAEARDALSGTTLLLLDDRGSVVAWSGKGLLHEIEQLLSPVAGRHYLASFSAVTLVVIQALEVDGKQWHLAAGASLRTEFFPFAEVAGTAPGWTVVAAGSEFGDDVLSFATDSGPTLVVEPPELDAATAGPLPPEGWRRLAVLLWAAVLLGMGWVRAAAGRVLQASAALGAGLLLLGLASHAPLWVSLLLSVGGGSVAWSELTVRAEGSPAGTLILGLAAGSVSGLAAWTVRQSSALPDLGSELGSTPADLATRVALAFAVWALLGAVSPARAPGQGRAGTPLGLALLSLIAACVLIDHAALAAGCLLLSGLAGALWRRRISSEETIVPRVVTVVVSVLIAAAGWELAFRAEQKDSIHYSLLQALAPPEAAEIESLADEMEAALGSWQLEGMLPAAIEGLSTQDLAFEIWRRSPLARYGGLSALRVLPHEGALSSFSYGLPLNREKWVDWSSPLLGTVPVPVWQDAVLVGDGVVQLGGESWAYAEYAIALQPGYRLREIQEGDLAEVLLRAGPVAGEAALLDLRGAVYGLFDFEGRPIVSPWPRPPLLPADVLAGRPASVETPVGRCWTFSAPGVDGVRVLFLPQLSPLAALERIGSHALPSLLILGALFLVVQLPGWIRAGLRSSWYHLWHSYSRRLVLVYSVLLLLPLGIINFLVVRAFEERLVREQQTAGLLAVESAQGVLGEYVLTLEPGFGINAALDDELLHWLSSVVHHDVNLYWRGKVYASSKAELFTAGLLPRRIPGEIYSALTLLKHEISTRMNQAGRSEYLELYAPLTVPGISIAQTRLIVSLPLLAQQEETEQQIASLRRRSLLGTAAVVLLIMAIGARLARRFTTPLTEIVEGTQRIAAGEKSLDLQPVELELSTLVEAIDDMALRIHLGRQELLREKRVVDRMVENITAGVVSLDENGRVLMANRVAGEMIGLRVGQELDALAEANERLTPLAEFVSGLSRDRLTQRTVPLESTDGEEQEWTLVWVPLPGEGEPSALLVLEDVTEVLRGQRLQAWAEMARMIAHEIKNPLTPIRLSTEHMKEVYESDPESFRKVFEGCTANILSQVGELQEIASEFSTYSRIPKIEPRPGNLVSVVEDIVGAYRSLSPNEARVVLASDVDEIEASFDAKLIGRAVRNLVENALRASPNGGRVEVVVEEEGDWARIVVRDEGPGVREALLARIFDPYFSTHDAGTGLGLPIAKRIAEEHGGDIVARNRGEGGLEVVITLPRR